MTYYKVPLPSKRTPRFNVNRLERPVDDENLTGWVNGQEASDLEERFARELRNLKRGFKFRVKVPTSISVPGQDKEVDFIVGDQPVEIDGDIGHQLQSQKDQDALRDVLLNEYFSKRGMKPVKHFNQMQLQTSEQVNRLIREKL